MFHTLFNPAYSELNLVSSAWNLLFLLCTLAQSMASSSRNDTQSINELIFLSLIHLLFSISLLALPIQPPKYPTYMIMFYPLLQLFWFRPHLFFMTIATASSLPSPFSAIYYGILHKFVCHTHTGTMLNLLSVFSILIYVLLKQTSFCLCVKLRKLSCRVCHLPFGYVVICFIKFTKCN